MDIERALLGKIIATGKLEEVVTKGVTAELFGDEECRDVFEWIQFFHRKWEGSVPSHSALEDEKPDFDVEHSEDPINYLIERFRKQVTKRRAQELVVELAESIDDSDESYEIEASFLEATRELSSILPPSNVGRFSDQDKRIPEYEKEAEEGVAAGIPYGFPTLDNWTGGVLSHEFVVAAAFSGVGKSTLLRTLAFNMYASDDDFVGLYITLEEEQKEILRKLDAMAADLDYLKLRQLKLKPEDIDRWREQAQKVRKKMKKKEILIIDDIKNCTPDRVYSETIRHKPDLVYVDYLTLMRSSTPGKTNSMWQSLTEITQDLKQNARILKVPIIAAAQTNRSGAKEGADLDNVGYGLSVVQDADVFIGLHADEAMRDANEMDLSVKKNRKGKLGRIRMIWNHEQSDYREKDITDMFGSPAKEPGGAPGKLNRDSIKKARGLKIDLDHKEEPREEEEAPRKRPARPRPTQADLKAKTRPRRPSHTEPIPEQQMGLKDPNSKPRARPVRK